MHPTASNLRVALYVRVSSGQPAEAKAIAQQLAELRHRIAKDGGSFDDGHCYIDRGVPGASLQRPALHAFAIRQARQFGSPLCPCSGSPRPHLNCSGSSHERVCPSRC